MNSTRGQPDPADRLLRQKSRAFRWAVVVGAAAMVAIGLVLMFLLTQATNNRELYERNYGRLFIVNVVVAALLLAVIAWMAIRLTLRLRRGKFGSRLLVKLAAIFALVGFVPGLLIYVVSYQFVSRSIESWFDVKVESALDAGVGLGRATLDTLSNDLASKTRAATNQLADVPNATAGLTLERIRDQLAASDVVLWDASGHLIAGVGQSRFDLNPERPGNQQLRNARSQRVVSQIEGLEDVGSAAVTNARIKVIALVNSSSMGLLAEPRFLQVTQILPPALVANAIAVQEANREYQERALARDGLRRMYIGTLTLSLFLAMFGAVLLAVLLGNQLARPLLVLAEGVRQVAAGDLTPKAALQGKDELGGLTRSFADMTQQLADARAAVNRSMDQVDASRANLLECAVVARRMREGAIEETVIPQNPLDVLAQQLVAMAALDEWNVDEVEQLVTASEPLQTLSREQLENVLDMLDGRYPSDRFAELRPRIVWDRTKGTMHGRKGARQLVVTNAGTIPDRGLYGVHLPDGRRVGELDEEMVYEARPGQTFLLGATTWRIEEITRDRVIVTPAPGVPGAVPFWKGDEIGRPAELGKAIGAFAREAVSREPAELAAEYDLDRRAA